MKMKNPSSSLMEDTPMVEGFTAVWFLEDCILRESHNPDKPFLVKWGKEFEYKPLPMGAVALFVQQSYAEMRRQQTLEAFV